MDILLKLALNKWTWIALLMAALSASVGIQTHRLHSSQAETAKVQGDYDQFKGGVAALGHEAEVRNAKQALADLKAKEIADEENLRTHAADRADIKRLRDDADRARRSPVPEAPAGSKRPDLACFDRTEFEQGYGILAQRLRDGARRIADQGTQATIDLDTAKRWALKLSTTLIQP